MQECSHALQVLLNVEPKFWGFIENAIQGQFLSRRELFSVEGTTKIKLAIQFMIEF